MGSFCRAMENLVLVLGWSSGVAVRCGQATSKMHHSDQIKVGAAHVLEHRNLLVVRPAPMSPAA